MEFRDVWHLRCYRTPPNLSTHCDGCGAKFVIAHGLKCNDGGLVNQRHDEIKFELEDLVARALIPSDRVPKLQPVDLLVRNLWKH